MNCKRIQELIITDYMDKEASPQVEEKIKAHLKACNNCRAFEKTLQEKVSWHFQGIKEIPLPERVWQRIKEAIEKEQPQYAPSFLERLLDFLRGKILLKRPAFAFSTAALAIMITVFFWQSSFRKQMFVKDYLTEQSEFMLSLDKPVNGDLEQAVSFNTAIERYLF